MTKEIIGIKLTDEQYKLYRITWDGMTLGDSRAYSKDQAIAEAKKLVQADPEYRVLDNGIEAE